jgi:hypothetical protein
MGWLWTNDVELLIAAYGADRAGRPPTECEAAARQAYTDALERECRWARLPTTTGSGLTLDLRQAFICVLAFRLSQDELQLCASGFRAAQAGRAPNERESAALQSHNSELERVSRLAGFGSVAEFQALCRRTEISKEGDRC